MSKCDHCPLAEGAECRSYPMLCRNLAVDPAKWRPILDGLNGAEPEYPSLAEMAGNYIKSTAKHIASGLKKAGKAEIARRLAICEACDQFDAKQKRCRACGCPTRAKAARAGEHCPLEKWAMSPEDVGMNPEGK